MKKINYSEYITNENTRTNAINVIIFPKETYLGINLNKAIVGVFIPRIIKGKKLNNYNSNLVFIAILTKLRKAFNSAISENKINLSLERMEQITEEMARKYCNSIDELFL